MPKTNTLQIVSIAEARRLALAAQGFDRKRAPGRVDARHFRRVMEAVRAVQIDFVNVLVPAHYLAFFSRIGPYERSRLDDFTYRKREVVEHWGHQASLVPVEHWPLLTAARLDDDRRVRALSEFAEANPDYLQRVLEVVREHGPITAAEIPHLEGAPDRPRDGWGWTVPKIALEALLVRGEVAVAHREEDLARAFDLAERIIPKKHRARTVDPEEAQRELMRLAARAQGVATAGDLAEYYGLPVTTARERIVELLDEEALIEVEVEGWRETAYLDPDAADTTVDAAALLSPFDSVVWSRPRADRLFGFEFTAELFVPRAKRRWGYYVLPFLYEDRLVGRVDLEADRKKHRLEVLAAYLEAGEDGGPIAETLAEELWALAEWLELEEVNVGRRGSLVVPLRGAVEG